MQNYFQFNRKNKRVIRGLEQMNVEMKVRENYICFLPLMLTRVGTSGADYAHHPIIGSIEGSRTESQEVDTL